MILFVKKINIFIVSLFLLPFFYLFSPTTAKAIESFPPLSSAAAAAQFAGGQSSDEESDEEGEESEEEDNRRSSRRSQRRSTRAEGPNKTPGFFDEVVKGSGITRGMSLFLKEDGDFNKEFEKLSSEEKKRFFREQTPNGHTPLHVKYIQGNSKNLQAFHELFGKEGILEGDDKIFQIKNIYGTNLFMEAAREGDVAMMREILKREPDIDINDTKGDSTKSSALMLAASSGNADAVKLLLELGAKINFGNKYGQTALSMTMTKKALSSDNDFKEIQKMLLRYGARVDLQLERESEGKQDLKMMQKAQTCSDGEFKDFIKNTDDFLTSLNVNIKKDKPDDINKCNFDDLFKYGKWLRWCGVTLEDYNETGGTIMLQFNPNNFNQDSCPLPVDPNKKRRVLDFFEDRKVKNFSQNIAYKVDSGRCLEETTPEPGATSEASPLRPRRGEIASETGPVSPVASPVRPRRGEIASETGPVSPVASPVRPRRGEIASETGPVSPVASPVRPRRGEIAVASSDLDRAPKKPNITDGPAAPPGQAVFSEEEPKKETFVRNPVPRTEQGRIENDPPQDLMEQISNAIAEGNARAGKKDGLSSETLSATNTVAEELKKLMLAKSDGIEDEKDEEAREALEKAKTELERVSVELSQITNMPPQEDSTRKELLNAAKNVAASVANVVQTSRVPVLDNTKVKVELLPAEAVFTDRINETPAENQPNQHQLYEAARNLTNEMKELFNTVPASLPTPGPPLTQKERDFIDSVKQAGGRVKTIELDAGEKRTIQTIDKNGKPGEVFHQYGVGKNSKEGIPDVTERVDAQ